MPDPVEAALALLEGETDPVRVRSRLWWAEVCGLLPDGFTAAELAELVLAPILLPA